MARFEWPETSRVIKPVYLIISQSGRMLAQAAFKGGYDCVVIDQFGDVDTQHYALAVKAIHEFSDENILCLIEQLWSEYSFQSIVLGSGLEDRLALMQQVTDRWPLSGNGVETVRVVKDPMRFSELLKDLGISHPMTQMTPPEAQDLEQQWLVKKPGGSGGEHVSWYSPDTGCSSNSYFQAFLSGTNYSVVFLADGKGVKVLGYNRPWPTPTREVRQAGQICQVDPVERDQSFRFEGAISLLAFPETKVVEEILERIVSAVKLVGLCGADFLLDDQNQIHLLEINPRPTATFDLHEGLEFDESGKGLQDVSQNNSETNFFQQHLNVCQGHLPARLDNGFDRNGRKFVSAKKIVYASVDLEMSEIDWPSWVSDIPQPGSKIKQGQPICTVYSFAKNNDEVEKRLENQCDMIQTLLQKNNVKT